MKKHIIGILFLSAAGLMACSHDRSPDSGNYDPNDPGYEYNLSGDMYHSFPYDPMTQYEGNSNPYNPDSMNMRLPVEGTVARGKASFYYPYPNSPEGYEMAKNLKNPIPSTPASIAEGHRLYSIYCWHCHGKTGDGDGPIMAAGKVGPPTWKSYNSDYIRNIPVGQMFHTITFGKNAMGPHGLLLTPEERWNIINFIKDLAWKSKPASGNTTAADSSQNKATASADSAKTTSSKPAK
jgi:mono/diheme cytochrome c family protein